MGKGKIFVYDDEPESATQYKNKLEHLGIVSKKFKVERITKEEFENPKKGIGILRDRREKLRSKKIRLEGSIFDEENAIFLIDYDLVGGAEQLGIRTGEDVAYFLRCFSKCGLIIGVSTLWDNVFDLSLKSESEHYLDLRIGGAQVDNARLWGEGEEEFRPWSWPDLNRLSETFEKRVRDVKSNFDKEIYDTLGFSTSIAKYLPPSVSEFLGGEPLKVTFRDFLTGSEKGLDGKDRDYVDNLPKNQQARLTAARLSRWLETVVLPDQDILVDAPHLVSRLPTLLKKTNPTVEDLNKTASFGDAEKLGLKHEDIEEFRFKKDYWLSRSAWFWSELSENIDWLKQKGGKRVLLNDNVFCEDTSRFHKRERCKEFEADISSPYRRRYVKKLGGDFRYENPGRLSSI
ncbi:hypothetical protein ACFLQ2_02840 [archaeon]